MSDAAELLIQTDDGVTLSGEDSDPARPGPPIVLLHGLTATRRYVVMGSRTLQRAGYRVIAYDARGHGRSTAAPDPQAYGYGASPSIWRRSWTRSACSAPSWPAPRWARTLLCVLPCAIPSVSRGWD